MNQNEVSSVAHRKSTQTQLNICKIAMKQLLAQCESKMAHNSSDVSRETENPVPTTAMTERSQQLKIQQALLVTYKGKYIDYAVYHLLDEYLELSLMIHRD